MKTTRRINDLKNAIVQKIEPELNTGCWLWSGAMMSDGYGYLYSGFGKKKIRAHRAAYYCFVGEVQDDLCVMHKCDTPACVNPAHLQLGTSSDNHADMVRKGRHRAPLGKTWRLPEGSRAREKSNRWGKRKTHCPKGHAYTPENTSYRMKNGLPKQRCKACGRLYWEMRKNV